MASSQGRKPSKTTDMQYVLREAWRKAYQEGEFSIPFERESDAYRFRIHMYGEKRKTPPEEIDQVLGLAYLHCEILNPKDCLLTIRLRMEGPMCQSALKAIGTDIGTLRDQALNLNGELVNTAASESMLKVLELLKGEDDGIEGIFPQPEGLITKNPYFTREE